MRRRLNSRPTDPHDEWLESLGLYRKQLARDGSCLFRAVAEQVFMTQTEHERVRALCLDYMVLHREDFEPFLDIPLDHHVFKLKDCREWGGHLEIMAMSRLFNVNFIIYKDIGKEPYKPTDCDGRNLLLSYTHGNHYDIVYKKDEASTRGFCQSLAYDMLYSQVFKLNDVRTAVDIMLHDKEYASLRKDSANSAELKEIGAIVEKIINANISRDSQDDVDKNGSTEERISVENVADDDVLGLLAQGTPPFPYKVAKSLDPDIYRNIEYDTWNTLRKEARFGPYDMNGFHAGVKVLIKLELLPNRKEIENMRKAHLDRSGNGDSNESKSLEEKLDVFHGHIQEMSENKGAVDVYIEEIGSRFKVPYESLERAPLASPVRSQGYHMQHQHQNVGASIPNYKMLTGFYQKAPLSSMENENFGNKKKNKGKTNRDASMFPNTPGRYGSAVRSGCSNVRGPSSSGSPTSGGQSPMSRGQGPSQGNYNRNAGRGMGRGTNNSMGSSNNPSEDFPSFSSSANLHPVGLEGVWAMKPNTPNQTMVVSTPKHSYYPTTPQDPPMGEDETRLQIQAETEALQKVMSVGGQIVRVSGHQLEVINSLECTAGHSGQCVNDNSNEANGKMMPSNMNPEVCEGHSPYYQFNPNLVYISTPPPQPPSATQIVTPMTPSKETLTPPPSVTPPPPLPPTCSTQSRTEVVDGKSCSSSELMKPAQEMTSVMVYQMPVMYGGYGYDNQPIPYMPIMTPPPNLEDVPYHPTSGTETYPPPYIPVSSWVPGFPSDVMPIPPYHHEPPLPPFVPPPSFPIPNRGGRGRGGPHHFNNSNYNHWPHNDGNNQGNTHRPLPPRFRRGGGAHSGRGGIRNPPPHYNSNSQYSNHRSQQYEGQPLLHMQTRKSNSDNSYSQIPPVTTSSSNSLNNPATGPVPYFEDRPPGVYPNYPQDLSLCPPQDSMLYYPVPPGYMMAPPWMWMM